MRDQDGNDALHAIEDERGEREFLVPRPQNIRRADVPRPDITDIAIPRELRENEAEGDGAE